MKRQLDIVIGLGEVLWDVFPDGPRFGGAPANYACHAACLGASAHVVSAVGRDDLGDRALRELKDHEVHTSAVQQSDYPTGAVHIQLDCHGKANYEFLPNTAWDHLAWSAELRDLAAQAAAVCFGTLGQRTDTSKKTIRRFIEATPASCLRIFDINLRPPYYTDETIIASLELANVLKLNDDELPIVATLCELDGTNRDMMRALARRFDLLAVALTRGDRGAILVRGDEVSEHGGEPATVIDTVGAGDAFTATMTIGLLAQLDLEVINDRASRVAAFVCSQAGATPRLPTELLA